MTIPSQWEQNLPPTTSGPARLVGAPCSDVAAQPKWSRATKASLILLGVAAVIGSIGLYLFIARIDVVGFLTESAPLFSMFSVLLVILGITSGGIGSVFWIIGMFRSGNKKSAVLVPVAVMVGAAIFYMSAVTIGAGELQVRSLVASEKFVSSEVAQHVNEMDIDLSKLGPIRNILDAFGITYPGKFLVDELNMDLPAE